MGFLHTPELLIIVVVALIFLGPKRLPEAGRSIGKAIRGFRDETQDLREDISSIKEDTRGLHQEVADVGDTVKTTVTGAVSVNGDQSTSDKGSVVDPTGSASKGLDDPMPVGANEELLKH